MAKRSREPVRWLWSLRWPARGQVRLTFHSDGRCFAFCRSGDEEELHLVEALAMGRAIQWGRRCAGPLPAGWSLVDVEGDDGQPVTVQ